MSTPSIYPVGVVPQKTHSDPTMDRGRAMASLLKTKEDLLKHCTTVHRRALSAASPESKQGFTPTLQAMEEEEENKREREEPSLEDLETRVEDAKKRCCLKCKYCCLASCISGLTACLVIVTSRIAPA